MDSVSYMVKWVLRISFVLWIATFLLVGRLPSPEKINPQLLQEPVQTSVMADKFTINYHDQNNIVVPVADYEIWGLLVSHNEPSAWYSFDLTHDSKSLDTRDVCVIWGDNVKTADYKKISYNNTDWSCVVSWKTVVPFNPNQLSNNHLITDNDEVRKTIAKLNVGDQIHIKGRLVNYSDARWNGSFRNTSLTRTDTGNGACEIIYVTEIEVIKSNSWKWACIHMVSYYTMLAMLLLCFVLFFRRA